MEYHNIEAAKKEAYRFILAVSELEERIRVETSSSDFMLMLGCKESAAVRRASMDLTRVLAKMRQP
jgi:hypothetical protein